MIFVLRKMQTSARVARAWRRVAMTLELLTATAWAPHPDQQQPLRPGSAKTRLADALGVPETPAGETAPNPKA